MIERSALSRRALLTGLGSAAFLAACGGSSGNKGANPTSDTSTATPTTVAPTTTTGVQALASTVPLTTAPPTTAAARATPTAPYDTAPGGAALYVANGPRTANHVALTFHTNGDLPSAQTYFAEWSRLAIPVTAFFVGTFLEAHPDFARALAAAGHDIGNHTWSHQTMGNLSGSAMHDEITKCRDLIAKVLGAPTPWFRPSGTDVPSAAILKAAGTAGYRRSIGYDVDPRDFDDPGSDVVISKVLAGAKPGAIISLHIPHPGTVKALAPIVAGLKSKGLQPVTLTQLLA